MPIDPPGNPPAAGAEAAADPPSVPIGAIRQPALYFHPDARAWVQRWAGRFRLVERPEPPVQPQAPALWAAPDHLELRFGGARDKGAWVSEAELRRRVRQTPELVRACGLEPGVRVLDAMAGWGLDGLVLAAAGARVTMVEREPLMQALQEDLIRRTGAAVAASFCGDGFLHLADERGFEVVYLDPMFPERGKQALPGKRMQYLAVLAAAPAPADAPAAAGAPADNRPLGEWVERSPLR